MSLLVTLVICQHGTGPRVFLFDHACASENALRSSESAEFCVSLSFTMLSAAE